MRKRRESILKGGLIALIAVMLFLPAMLNAGSLEPSGAPAPTMKTMDEIGSWSKKLSCAVGNCPRFVVLSDFNNEAVLDKETGLVWVKSPNGTGNWAGVMDTCITGNYGNRGGWHLPTIEQLTSLIDISIVPPALPSGHPFTNLNYSNYYWSATTYSGDTNRVKILGLDYGSVGTDFKTAWYYFWCVRGGQSHDGQ